MNRNISCGKSQHFLQHFRTFSKTVGIQNTLGFKKNIIKRNFQSFSSIVDVSLPFTKQAVMYLTLKDTKGEDQALFNGAFL